MRKGGGSGKFYGPLKTAPLRYTAEAASKLDRKEIGHFIFILSQGTAAAELKDMHLPSLRPLLLRHLLRVHHPPVHEGRQERHGRGNDSHTLQNYRENKTGVRKSLGKPQKALILVDFLKNVYDMI